MRLKLGGKKNEVKIWQKEVFLHRNCVIRAKALHQFHPEQNIVLIDVHIMQHTNLWIQTPPVRTGCDDEIQKLSGFCPSPEICSETNMNKIGGVEVLFSRSHDNFWCICVFLENDGNFLFCFAITKVYQVL